MSRPHVRRLRSRPAAAAAGILAAGLLAAPAGAQGETPGPATGTVARTVGDARYEPGACPKTPEPVPELEGARCGTLTVPENRAKADSRKITLGVAIVPAVAGEPKPDPIVLFVGGPGNDAVSQAKMAVDGGLNRDRDVILMSQRGTYSADPELTCRTIDEFEARAVGLVYNAPSTESEHLAAIRSCRDQLAARGVDLGAYNDAQSSADYADLRRALDIPQWNVYGLSYGTHLALIYMRDHPEGIRSVGLDGVLPPSKTGYALAWSSARQGIDSLFKACADQPECDRRYPNLPGTFERLVRQLDAEPVTTTVRTPGSADPVKVVLDGGALMNWMTTATHVAPGVPRSLDELAHGKPQRIAEQWAASRVTPELFGRISHGLEYGVFCGEWVPYETEAEAMKGAREAFPKLPPSVLAQAPQLTFVRPDCAVWDVPALPRSIRDVTRSDIPTLVMSGGFDSQTGAESGAYVARTLPRATVVTVPYVPHVVFATSKCAQSIARSFFDDPAAPDTGCLKDVKPPEFEIAP
ncbi:alpha/beta fold hydrolase [Streptomyces sp. NPDC048337]|uniref:alpha/beta fold hydrolase n=1 Tax=Streptomyces sp. NPDC048337 TaxID=3365535 RepID=UPI003723386A